MGQSQIVLVFIASLVLFAKDMPEQDGKPGNLFKGPLFAAVMVAIGTMTLAMTAYTLLVENFDIKNADDAEEAAATAAGKARKFFNKGKKTDDDAAPEQVVVTPHGDVEAPDAFLAPGVAPFIVSGKDGGRLRAGVEMDSPLVADLPSGTRVVVEERATSRTGVERCRVSSGKSEGWLSAKVLAPADGA